MTETVYDMLKGIDLSLNFINQELQIPKNYGYELSVRPPSKQEFITRLFANPDFQYNRVWQRLQKKKLLKKF